MHKLNTHDTVRKFATNCVGWLDEGSRLELAKRVCFSYQSRVGLSLWHFRLYLDRFMREFVDGNIRTDNEIEMGHYVLRSSADKDYVTVTRSKKRLPRVPADYIGWVDWDIQDSEEPGILTSKCVHSICMDNGGGWRSKSDDLIARFRLMHVSILSQVLLQSLFNLVDDIDLSKKPLPSKEVNCRVGDYIMLYDNLMQEWRIWNKG